MPHTLEEDVRIELAPRLSILEKALNLPGVKILDSSIISPFLGDYFLHKGDLIAEHLALYLEKEWHSIICNLLSPQIIVSSSTIDEFYRGTVALRRSRKKMKTDSIRQGTISSGRKRISMSSLRTHEYRNFGNHVSEEVLERKKIIETFKLHRVLNYLSPLAKDTLSSIRNAILEISHAQPERKNKSKKALPQHEDNDAFTFAEALSLDRSVIIITEDYDFKRLSRAYWPERARLAQSWGYAVPKHPIDIAFPFSERPFIYRPWGESLQL